MPWMPVNGNAFPDFWLAGVTWSIRYEGAFYISLPLFALLCRRRRVAFWSVTFALGLLLSRHAARAAKDLERPGSVLVCLFLVGMLCASLRRDVAPLPLRQPWSSALSVALVIIAFSAREPYTWRPVLCLGGVFFLVCQGCTMFGLLTLGPIRRMGDISYGIYLLQGLMLSLCFLPLPLRQLALKYSADFWLLTLVSGMLLLLVATFAHVYVERPGIAAGRSIASQGLPFRSEKDAGLVSRRSSDSRS